MTVYGTDPDTSMTRGLGLSVVNDGTRYGMLRRLYVEHAAALAGAEVDAIDDPATRAAWLADIAPAFRPIVRGWGRREGRRVYGRTPTEDEVNAAAEGIADRFLCERAINPQDFR